MNFIKPLKDYDNKYSNTTQKVCDSFGKDNSLKTCIGHE